MRHPAIPILLVLACVAAALVLAMFGGLFGGAELRPAASTFSDSEMPTAPPGAERSRSVETASAQRVAVGSPASVATPRTDTPLHRATVRVVDARDRAPVAGATVAWSRDRRSQDEDGASVVTDANGECVVEHLSPRLRVEAWTDEGYGMAYLVPDHRVRPDPVVIVLEADYRVAVRTVRADRSPVSGVAIEIVPQRTTPGLVVVRHLGTTDADGLFVWRHMQERLDGDERSAVLVATILGAEFGRTEVRLDELPREPIEIVVPGHGALDVRVLGANGQLEAPERLNLRCGKSRRSMTGADLVADVRGNFVIEPVALGQEIEIEARGPFTSRNIELQGPTVIGERVAVTIAVDPRAPVVQARIVDAHGAPHSGDFRVMLVPEPENDETKVGATVRLTGGVLLASVPVEFVGARLSLEVRDVAEENAIPHVAHSVGARQLRPGTNDFGELALMPLRRALAVRTVRADGRPVPAVVHVFPPGAGRSPLNRLEHGVVRRPELGLTELYTEAQADRYRVDVQRPWQRVDAETGTVEHDTLELSPAEQPYSIQVVSGGSLTADFLVDDETPWEGLSYRLDATAPRGDVGAGEGRRTVSLLEPTSPSPGQNPRVHAEGLREGHYALSISCFGSPDPLIEIRDLYVPSGGACEDERLRDIDLRGRLRGFALRLVDAEGAPLTRAMRAAVIVHRGWDTTVLRGRIVEAADGVVRVEAERPVELIACSKRHMTVALHGVAGGRTVVLPEPPKLRFTAPALADTDLSMRLTLTPATPFGQAKVVWSPRGREADSISNMFDTVGANPHVIRLESGRTAAESFRWPDTYRVSATLTRGGENPFEREVPVQPSRIDVRVGDDGRAVELRVDAAALRAARAASRR